MSEWKAKRFWTTAEARPAHAGWEVALDGRPVRTPAKAPLVLPTEEMARAVAAEWQAQGETIDPLSMPVTRGANAAIDKVVPQQAEVVEILAAYGDADLLCYRAEAPEALAARQAELWDPLLDWAAQTFGARLIPRAGVIHAPQDAAALARLRAEVAALTPFELAAFYDLVQLSGSLVIALAVARGAGEAAALWEVSRLDEAWQAEQWGEDEEAAEVAARRREAFLEAARFFAAARPKA